MKSVSNKELNDLYILKNYAEKAKENISNNSNLHRIINLYNDYIKKIKNILFEKEKIEENIKNLNNYLKNKIETTKGEIQKLKNRYDNFYQKCTDELEMERPTLDQARSDQLTLKFSLIQNNFLIQKIKENLKNSKKFNLFREPKRELFLEIKEANKSIVRIAEDSQLDLLLEAKKYNSLKEKMKNKKLKIIKLKEKIKELKKLINGLKRVSFIEIINNPFLSNEKKNNSDQSTVYGSNSQNNKGSEKVKISKNEIFSFCDSKKFEEDSLTNEKKVNNNINSKNINYAISSTKIENKFGAIKSMSVNPILEKEFQKKEIYYDYNKGKKIMKEYDINSNKALSENRKINKIQNRKKNKNKIIQSFLNLEDLFEITDNEKEDGDEVLIEVVLHSDDEIILENNIRPKKTLSETYKEKIEKEIPKINLSLIEYNKLKIYQEIDLYSLQRRNYKEQSIEEKIKILLKEIKKIKNKENLNCKKAKVMKKFIDDLKDKYILYKSIKTKSSAINCEVKYISNNEIVELKNTENDSRSIGSDYLNEDDEISEKNN